MAVLEDDLDQFSTAQLLGQRPGLCLVEPHQRRVQHEASVHAEIERDLQRLDGVVAAVGIAGEVRLAHAAHQVGDGAPPGDGGGKGEEQQIAPGHEAVGQAVLLHLEGDVTRERRLAELAQHAHVDEMVLAEPARPGGKPAANLLQHHKSLIQLDSVPLAVVKSDRLDMRKSL
jgi:hypothetical protein